jgi:predicted nuclease with TOPRIM domain
MSKILELDKELHDISGAIKALQTEKKGIEVKNASIFQKINALKAEIKNLEEQIKLKKDELIVAYLKANMNEPYPGALHYFREDFNIEVIKKEKVPEIYKEVDISKVKDAIKGGIEKIPGITIVKTKLVVLK